MSKGYIVTSELPGRPASCFTKESSGDDGRGLTYIAVGSLSCLYGTTIRGCGVVDTIHQVVNSTCGSIHMGFFYSSIALIVVSVLIAGKERTSLLYE